MTAALVPETVLVLAGGAGRAATLEPLRERAEAALRDVVSAAPARVVMVLLGPRRVLHLPTTDPAAVGAPRVTLGALGVPDDVLDRETGAERGAGAPDAPVVHEPGAAVALTLLGVTGYRGPVEMHVLAAEDQAQALALGEALERAGDRVAVVMVGSLSARRGPSAPLPEDPRAEAFADRATAALVALTASDREWLRDSLDEAGELAASAALPWVVLSGAVEAGARMDVHRDSQVDAPFGADLLVLSWGRTAQEQA